MDSKKITVDIKGLGVVRLEVPKGMTEEEIKSLLAKNYGSIKSKAAPPMDVSVQGIEKIAAAVLAKEVDLRGVVAAIGKIPQTKVNLDVSDIVKAMPKPVDLSGVVKAIANIPKTELTIDTSDLVQVLSNRVDLSEVVKSLLLMTKAITGIPDVRKELGAATKAIQANTEAVLALEKAACASKKVYYDRNGRVETIGVEH